MALKSIPPLLILNEIQYCFILADEDSAIKFVLDRQLLENPEECIHCESQRVVIKKPPFELRCKDCRKQFSMKHKTYLIS